MTQAQKLAKAKFKQAIAYRTKTGVSLKEAFAHIYGKKKVVKKTAKKVVKKVAKKRVSGVKDSALVKKELAKKGLKMPHGYETIKRKRKISGIKKKNPSEQGILNRIHKVKKDVERLDEAQHKHMIGMNNDIYHKMAKINTEIISKERGARKWIQLKKGLVEKYGLLHYKKILDNQRKMINELKKHKTELKKLL
jgi:hypothetical protein